MYATGRGCDEYSILSSHRTTTQYYVTAFPYDGGYRDGYYDIFDYLFSSEQGQIEDYVSSMFFSALTAPRVLDQPVINLGSTEYISIGNCVRPTITEISPEKGSVGGKISVSIDGTGFTPTTTIVAPSGISASITNRYGSTSIIATFTISGNATAGDNEVKVKAGNLPSNAVNFFVQIPKKANREDIKDTVILDPGPGNIVNYNGQNVQTGVCGAYRNLKYKLLDQNDDELNLGTVDENIGLSIVEILSNFQSNPSGITAPTAENPETNNIGEFIDIIAAFQAPPCMPPFSFTQTQKFKVVVGTK